MTFLLVGVKVKDFTKDFKIKILLRILLWILLIFMGLYLTKADLNSRNSTKLRCKASFA